MVPEGVYHRADTYTKPEQFEYAGSYEADARYITPARNLMINKFIDKSLSSPGRATRTEGT